MRVGLLIVAHRRVGSEILATASRTLGICPLQTRSLEVMNEDEMEQLAAQAREWMSAVDDGAGTLVLTDAYGSTPANVAVAAGTGMHCRIVTGINLPMLLRVFNYPERTLDAMAESAVTAGRAGILQVDDPGAI